jgi:hypothetical protein
MNPQEVVASHPITRDGAIFTQEAGTTKAPVRVLSVKG